MRAQDITSLQINYDGTWLDYSDGTINIDIVRGVQSNTGPWSMPDVGQLRVTSRNPNLDPYENIYVKYGAPIRIMVNAEPIFTGKMTAINVDYRPKGEPPLITINAIDYVGTLERTILPQAFANQRAQYWSTNALFQDLEYDVEFNQGQLSDLPGLVVNRVIGNGLDLVMGSIDNGQSWWQAITDRTITDKTFAYVNRKNELNYLGIADYQSASHPNINRPIAIEFASDGSKTGYKDITLEDGFERIVNYLNIGYRVVERNIVTNEVTSTYSGDTFRLNQTSIDIWTQLRKDINLVTGVASNFNEWATEVFAEVGAPQIEITDITWDGLKNVSAASTVDILDNINIDHEVGNGTIIDRKYGVVGIRHQINESDWRVSYILKNFNYAETAFPTPQIAFNSFTGDTNFNFEFSIANIPEQEVVQAYWNFGDGDTEFGYDQIKNYNSVGTFNVTVEVTNYLGQIKTSNPLPIQVYGAVPDTDFSYAITPTSFNTVQFTFTGSFADSFLWDFGDGTTSTDVNPMHTFLPNSTNTVTLTCTNSYGSSQHSDTVVIGSVPSGQGTLAIRYVKIEQPAAFEDQDSGNDKLFHNLTYFRIAGTSGGNLSLAKPAQDLVVTQGQVSNKAILGTSTASCYGDDRTFYQGWNPAIEPTRLTTSGGGGIDPLSKYDDSQPGTCKYSEWSVVIDLGVPYNTFDEIQVSCTPVNYQQYNYPTINVYGSVDNQNWTKIGDFQETDAQGPFFNYMIMDPVGAMPPNL